MNNAVAMNARILTSMILLLLLLLLLFHIYMFGERTRKSI